MVEEDRERINRPGFQGSENVWCRFVVYHHGDDPFVIQPGSPIRANAVSDREDAPMLTDVTVTKTITGGNSWSATIRPPKNVEAVDFLDAFVDDDWVDIEFFREGKRYHVLRGQIDVVSLTETSAAGPTSREILLFGSDHSGPWQKSRVFFNTYAAENVAGGATMRAAVSKNIIQQTVGETVDTILRNFLELLNDYGRVNWEMPEGMAGRLFGETEQTKRFIDVVDIDNQERNFPARHSYNNHLVTADNVTLWDLAREWSDPMFVEFFTEQYNTTPGLEYEEAPIDKTTMTVLVRDKPFLDPLDPDTQSFGSAYWWELPTFTETRQGISTWNVSRTGDQRVNTFLVQTKVTNENSGDTFKTRAPLWDPQDILRHGVRPWTVTTNYLSSDAATDVMARTLRQKMLYWHAYEAYFWTGVLGLNHGRPDLKLGTRFVVPPQGPRKKWQFYVDGYQHSWQAGRLRTQIQVSRGFKGSDEDLVSAIRKRAERFQLGLAAVPGQVSLDVVIGRSNIA